MNCLTNLHFQWRQNMCRVLFHVWCFSWRRCKLYSFSRVLICLYRFHCSESKHHNTIVMAYEVRILIIFYISRISKTELIWENQQTWRKKKSFSSQSIFYKFYYFPKFSFSAQNVFVLSILQHAIASQSNHINTMLPNEMIVAPYVPRLYHNK
jgi:hypothetical protein